MRLCGVMHAMHGGVGGRRTADCTDVADGVGRRAIVSIVQYIGWDVNEVASGFCEVQKKTHTEAQRRRDWRQ